MGVSCSKEYEEGNLIRTENTHHRITDKQLLEKAHSEIQKLRIQNDRLLEKVRSNRRDSPNRNHDHEFADDGRGELERIRGMFFEDSVWLGELYIGDSAPWRLEIVVTTARVGVISARRTISHEKRKYAKGVFTVTEERAFSDDTGVSRQVICQWSDVGDEHSLTLTSQNIDPARKQISGIAQVDSKHFGRFELSLKTQSNLHFYSPKENSLTGTLSQGSSFSPSTGSSHLFVDPAYDRPEHSLSYSGAPLDVGVSHFLVQKFNDFSFSGDHLTPKESLYWITTCFPKSSILTIKKFHDRRVNDYCYQGNFTVEGFLDFYRDLQNNNHERFEKELTILGYKGTRYFTNKRAVHPRKSPPSSHRYFSSSSDPEYSLAI